MVKYLFLGVVQGLTEFLPVSSSGHLVILQKMLGLDSQGVLIPVVLHSGTCLALVIFFFKDILALLKDRGLFFFTVVVTLITGVIGVAGKDFFEGLFSSPKIVAGALVITAAILLFTRKFADGKRTAVGFKDASILGLVQGIAIIPGISRSGITISALLFRGLTAEISFKLSFLVSIPAVFGAIILEAKGIRQVAVLNWQNLVVGFIFSCLTGLISLAILRLILRKTKLHYFGYYCLAVAFLTLLFIG